MLEFLQLGVIAVSLYAAFKLLSILADKIQGDDE